jgi:predicted outer membrane repeat protein
MDKTGGGMFIRSSSPTLMNLTFSGNVAELFGGGISHTDSSATLTNVTFKGNSASTNGGAMWNGYASHPTLTNVTFSGNSGGAMFNTDGSSLMLTNVTSSGNAGIAVNNYDTSIALIYDSIFWADGAEIVSTSGTTVRDSIVQGGYACTGCAHIVNLDPLLASLANNGGYTRTMALGGGSPAIDAGNNATCASTDQRGRPRPADGDHNGTSVCDMGAFEVPVFTDMPVADKEWMEGWVNIFYQHGVTTGCGAGPMFCPENNVTRAEMAVFLLRAKHGAGYAPPTAIHHFLDVPVTGKEWMEPWIDQYYVEGLTTGCGSGNFCPENNVTRAEMAVFVLRSTHAPGWQPPTLSHYFSDMPVLGKEWMEPWVDEFKREGITTGCGGGHYCPESSVTRAEMAVFIGRAYHFYP